MSVNEKMTALADAVRSKANRSDTLTIDAMTAAVNGLVVGNPSTQTLTVIPTKEKQTFSSSDLGANTYYSTVTVTAIPSNYVDTIDATASASDIRSGKIAYTAGGKVEGAMIERGTVDAKISNRTKGWSSGPGYYEWISVSVTSKELNITPSKDEQVFDVVFDEESDVFYSRVTVNAIPAEYIATADATATEGTILEGKTAYVNGSKVTGKYIAPSPEDVRYGVGFGFVDLLPDYSGGDYYSIGSFTGDATAAASDIASGKTAYVNGVKVTGTSEGGETFYKCTAVFGPSTVTFLTVTGAGADCNGRYDDSGMKKNGNPVYQFTNTSGKTWYIYYFKDEYEGNYWLLCDNRNVDYPYGAHYFSSNLTSGWQNGEYGEGSSPTVTRHKETINADQPKVWNGKKVMLNNEGAYSFDENVTTGLSYGTAFTPTVGSIYNPACTMLISRLWRAKALFTAIKFQIDRVKNSDGVQMSEFTLVDYDGNEIDWLSLPISSVIADSGNDSPSGEEPEKLLDGNKGTKWFSWQFNAPSFVQINFNSAISFNDIAGYRWYTAGDSSGRDPVSWKVLSLNQQGEWEAVSEVIDYPVTESRKTLVGTWDFNF